MSAAAADDLAGAWQAAWEPALAAWSRFTKLSPPRWCLTEEDEAREELTRSFAMIRLVDHAVVVSLRRVRDLGLRGFAPAILAHEIGHHVFAPADLADNARLLARVRAGLPTRESMAPYVANLYTDLLINDRLQRSAGLDVAGVYRALRRTPPEGLWAMYLRIYETLWRLPYGTLGADAVDERIASDAALGARLVRVYAKDWLKGAGRFAALCLPYLLEQKEEKVLVYVPWFDTEAAGAGEELPDGLAGIDDDELDGAIHPAEDPDLRGLGLPEEEDLPEDAAGRATVGGRKHRYRDPDRYVELMKSLGVRLDEKEIVIRYYRELARPHLIRFPMPEARQAEEPLAEGLETWEPGAPLSEIDWTETASRSPYVIPGVTTVQRTYGTQEGGAPARRPVDLYLGIDCSGSMPNPRCQFSHPVLAGAIVALSALRAGAKVQAVLSGEPGQHASTDGFVGTEHEVLKLLTGYLGTGYAFGVLRLEEAFLSGPPPKRPVHVLLVTDGDWFTMLKREKAGWEIAEQAVARAGAGATCVLHVPSPSWVGADAGRLQAIGWNVHFVATMEDLLAFARAFSRMKYGREASPASPRDARPAGGGER